jgi:hypothetical protein
MRRFNVQTFFLTVLLFLSFVPAVLHAQTDSFSKNFKKFRDIAPGVDFFAGQRSDVTPFEKPITEGRQKLAAILGDTLSKGAIVICSTMEQKDSVNETKVLKMGYRWVLIQLTPAAINQQMLTQMKAQMEKMKAQMGEQLPPGLLERLQNPSTEVKAAGEARLVATTVQQFAYAVLSTTLAPEKEFRLSRLDDMGRSPLADWLDIGLAAYAAGNPTANLKFLQDHMDEAFPLEDLLEMSRPFVAPGTAGGLSAGGPTIVMRAPGPAPGGGAPAPPGPPGARGSGAPSLPKDIQDRMTFDAQAASFFTYFHNKFGLDKVKALVQWNREGKSVREFLTRADLLGPDLDRVEKDWQTWVKAQKADTPGSRIIVNPAQK